MAARMILPGFVGTVTFDTEADMLAARDALEAALAAGTTWTHPVDAGELGGGTGEWHVLPGGIVIRTGADAAPPEDPPAPE